MLDELMAWNDITEINEAVQMRSGLPCPTKQWEVHKVQISENVTPASQTPPMA